MEMKMFLNSLLICAALVSGLAHADHTDGWPLPWPFPVAIDCPMDWKNLNGVYLLSDSKDEERLTVKISVVTKKGIRLVRVSRYTRTGHLMFDGTAFVTERQKIIGLFLH